MTGPVYQSTEFNGGGYSFFTGKVAMSENFLWSTYGVADSGDDWDLVAIPSNGGTTTAAFNADTFRIMKSSKHPDAAFAVLTYLLGEGSTELLQAYGGMPAREAEQDAFFDALGKTDGFPTEVDWQVAKDGIQYADEPNFEAPMPKYNESLDLLGTFLTKWTSTAGLNMDAEIADLESQLQAIWNK
jgi:multiple sugar transport system substrate-binding protein